MRNAARGGLAKRSFSIRGLRVRIPFPPAASLRTIGSAVVRSAGEPVAAPSTTWADAAAEARYLILLFAETSEARDPRRQKLIAKVLDDLAAYPTEPRGGRSTPRTVENFKPISSSAVFQASYLDAPHYRQGPVQQHYMWPCCDIEGSVAALHPVLRGNVVGTQSSSRK
jgi:hypothetical protein